MTDGHADYPQAEVNQLANFLQDKLQFFGVGFGREDFSVI